MQNYGKYGNQINFLIIFLNFTIVNIISIDQKTNHNSGKLRVWVTKRKEEYGEEILIFHLTKSPHLCGL